MKRLLIAITIWGALLGGVVIGRAEAPPTIKTYQNGHHETQYVIPASGSYCFSASPDLPLDLPVCGVNPHEAVTPDSNVGPTVVCPPGEIEIVPVAPAYLLCAKPVR